MSKRFLPDISAIKFLLELNQLDANKFSEMTDEELEEEKTRLLKLLSRESFEEDVHED